VAVGEGGTIVTSTDGISWTERTSRPQANLSGINYGNGRWVAVGTETVQDLVLGAVQRGTILTSPDGILWAVQSTVTGIQPQPLSGISYGNGLLVAVGGAAYFRSDGEHDFGTVLTSPDGIGWTVGNSAPAALLSAIIYANGQWVVVGSESVARNTIPPPFPAHAGTILTSPNGINWTARTAGTQSILNGIGYANRQMVAVGSFGAVLTSSDGINWTVRKADTPNALFGIANGNGLWVAVGANGTILTSGETAIPPRLSITRSGANAVVAWPTDTTGFVLETTTDMAAQQGWSAMTATPTIVNSQNTITDTISGSARFYRLRK
jgi:hypothetical protein